MTSDIYVRMLNIIETILKYCEYCKNTGTLPSTPERKSPANTVSGDPQVI